MTQALGMAPGMSSLVMYIVTGGLANQTIDDAGIFNAMATAKPLNAQFSSSWAWRPTDSTTDNPYFEEFAAQGQNLFSLLATPERGNRVASFGRRIAYMSPQSAEPTWTPLVRAALGSETGGPTPAAASGPISLPFPRGKSPRPPVAPIALRLIATARMFPRTANFTLLCLRRSNHLHCQRLRRRPVSPLPCGPAIWLSPTSRPLKRRQPLGFINPGLYTIGGVQLRRRFPRHHRGSNATPPPSVTIFPAGEVPNGNA